MSSEQLIRNAQRYLSNLQLAHGANVYEENVQKVLSAFWEASRIIGTPGTLVREAFECFLQRASGKPTGNKRYVDELFRMGCFL